MYVHAPSAYAASVPPFSTFRTSEVAVNRAALSGALHLFVLCGQDSGSLLLLCKCFFGAGFDILVKGQYASGA